MTQIFWKPENKNLLAKHQNLLQKLIIILKRLCPKDEKLTHETAEGVFTYHPVSMVFIYMKQLLS